MNYLNIAKEIFIGIFLIIFGVLLSVTIANAFSNVLKKYINKYILFILHIFIIVGFIMLLRINVKKVIINKDVFDSIVSTIGPIIGGVSFYFSPFVKSLARELLQEPDPNSIKTYYFNPNN